MKIRTHVTLDERLNTVVVEAAERERRPVSTQLELIIEAGLKALGLLAMDTEQHSEQFVEAFTGDKK
jgi:ABC-type xylose transport system substrate-binding protein